MEHAYPSSTMLTLLERQLQAPSRPANRKRSRAHKTQHNDQSQHFEAPHQQSSFWPRYQAQSRHYDYDYHQESYYDQEACCSTKEDHRSECKDRQEAKDQDREGRR
jgi:hypothetical protein